MNDNLKISHIADMESLTRLCGNHNLYIYGAGMRASSICEFVRFHGIEVCSFVVSYREGNPEEKNGLPVITADAYSDESGVVIFGLDVKDESACYRIVAETIAEVYMIDSAFYDASFTEFFAARFKQIFPEDSYEIISDAIVERHHLLCRYSDESGEVVFRISPYILNNDNLQILRSKLHEHNPLEVFVQTYGDCIYLGGVDGSPAILDINDDKLTVYMARCHVDKVMDLGDMPSYITPIQTGAALTDQIICDVRDNIGDNISDRNRDYSECTAIYWMWKNALKSEYIGLCHYRRHFSFGTGFSSEHESNDLREGNDYSGFDVIVTVPTINTSNYDSFIQHVRKRDIELVMEMISQFYPEYGEAAKTYYDTLFGPPCNMFIMKYDVFQEFAEFYFGVMLRIDDIYRSEGVVRNDRYMGFLAENLMDIFLIRNRNRLTVGYTDMKFVVQ